MTMEERRENHRLSEKQRRERMGAKPRRTDAIVEQIREAYGKYPEASYEFIARIINVSWSTVRYHAKRLRLKENGSVAT